MKVRKLSITVLLFAALCVGSANAATITVQNLNAAGDGAFGIRDSSNVLISSSDFKGLLGTFGISNSTIASEFAAGNFSAIQSGFQQFDTTPNGTYPLNSLADGVFQSSLNNDTKAASNSFGGSSIYTVFFKGATLATATELLVAQLNSFFPTDPDVGAPLLGDALFRPDTISNLVVGTALGASFNHDYGLGGGALQTFALQAVPEPSKLLFIGFGVVGGLLRRRRC